MIKGRLTQQTRHDEQTATSDTLRAGGHVTRLLERLFPYLLRKGQPPAWRLSPEGAEVVEWERNANVEISVQWRVSPAWLSSAPEYGPGWQATIRPRDGGRKATAVRPTQVEAIAAARQAYEARQRPSSGG